MQKICVIGYGDVGQRVARLWLRQHARVQALVRRSEMAAQLDAQGLTSIVGDLDHPDSLLQLPFDMPLYIISPRHLRMAGSIHACVILLRQIQCLNE